MKKLKILLLGITGDLSKKKILPAIAQFSELKKNDFTLDLIGYSRSQANLEDIQDLLDDHSSTKKHFVNNIELVQGEYSDPSFFIKLLESLEENTSLITYFAVPPIVFLNLLEIFCPYGRENFDIVLEKPFGNDLAECDAIIQKIQDCKLEKNVHFFDHYLFKTSTDLTPELKNLVKKSTKNIKSISIKSIEKVSLEGRAGYFEGVGTLKDVFPSHHLSLLDLGIKSLGESDELDFKDLFIKNLKLGQYESYLSDLGQDYSKTDTYFHINAELNDTHIIFESGKNLGQKLTEIKVTLSDNTEIIWDIDPTKSFFYQNQKYDLNRNNFYDHTNMFLDVVKKDFSKFLSIDTARNGWIVYDRVIDFKTKNDVSIEIYRDGGYPVIKK